MFVANPITSSMSKYYEKTKSGYSRDIDHLVTFNKNGLWIKENFDEMQRIISAEKPKNFNLINVSIFHLDNKSSLIEKIQAKSANIERKEWILKDVKIFKSTDGIIKRNVGPSTREATRSSDSSK